jgi:chemotaxis protein CheX
MTFNPTEDDLRRIVEQVWSSYLNVDGSQPLVVMPVTTSDGAVTASVSVTGSWRGHVLVTCSDTAARNVAAVLLGVEFGDVAEGDIADALGELANVIGGNIKSILPDMCALSLPHVHVEGSAGRYPASAEICRLSGIWLDDPVTVTVLESTADLARVDQS